MRVANREAYEWRRIHRREVIAQIQPYLRRVARRGSAKSVDNATTGMVVFCSYLKMPPKDVVAYLQNHDVYEVLDGYVDWMVNECKFAPNSLRNHLSVVKKFLNLSGVEVNNERMRAKVELPRFYSITRDRAPTQDELRRILTHTDVRGKALVTMLCSSGMRIGELLSLRVKDIDFSTSPVTVNLRAEVTKDRQARYCFVSDEAVTFLREFSGQRLDSPQDYIFPTSTRGRAHRTGNIPMTYWNADEILSRALRATGLDQKDDNGRDVIHIHTLRKFFFSQLVPTLGREVVEALMGHKAFLDAAYRRFTAEQMRGFYLKGMDSLTILLKKQGMSEGAVIATFNRQYLVMAGYSEEEVSELGDLSQLNVEQVQELIRQKQMQSLGLNGNHQKIVGMSEVENWVTQGWDFVTPLPDGKAIIKLPT